MEIRETLRNGIMEGVCRGESPGSMSASFRGLAVSVSITMVFSLLHGSHPHPLPSPTIHRQASEHLQSATYTSAQGDSATPSL